MDDPRSIYEKAIVVDMTCPAAVMENILRDYRKGGFTVIAVTAGYGMRMKKYGPMEHTLRSLGMWLERIRASEDFVLVTSVEDIHRAKREGKLGILFHFQGTRPLEGDLNSLEAYYRMGLRVLQLCYNVKDLAGCGCTVMDDTGLTDFGRAVVAEANRLGVVVDCAHTGTKTTMDAIEASTAPVIISHGNAKAVHPNDRNLSDELIQAIANKGGVVGLNGYPCFVSKSPRPTLDEFIDHIEHVARVAGIDHVGIGNDYFEYQDGYCDLRTARMVYRYLLFTRAWNSKNYAPPPWYYPHDIEHPDSFGNLAAGLLRRGFSPEGIEKILGGNILRVYQQVWK